MTSAALASGSALAQPAPAPAQEPTEAPPPSPPAEPAAPVEPAPTVAQPVPPPPPVVQPVRGAASMVMPFVGLNSFQGDNTTDYGVGLRLGTLLGGRLTENFSMNGEVAIDVGNLNPPAGDASAYAVDLAVAPLLHAPADKLELVAGPIAGVFGFLGHASGGGITEDVVAWGWVLGVNAGALYAVNDAVRVGGLFSFVSRNPLQACTSGTGLPDQCQTTGLRALKVLGFSLVAMF